MRGFFGCGGIGRISASLHKKAKTKLYRKLRASLKDGGHFIFTDYIIDSDEEEEAHINEYNRLCGLQVKRDVKFCHYGHPAYVRA